jgi:hypothetical protein
MLRRATMPLALMASLAFAAPAFAGGGAPPLDPSVVGVPIARTSQSLDKAADAIDAGKGATAAGPLRASRRYLIRSYRGAKYLIANMPPAPPADAKAQAASVRKFKRMARRAIRASRHGGGWITAGTGAAGPAFADTPTAVFDVFTSQYGAATAAVGMASDTKGNLLKRVQTTLNTAIVLRNRLVKIIATQFPPAPPEAGKLRAHASGAPVAANFDSVMPGIVVLIDDELQQMKAAQADASTPAASSAALDKAIAADQQIEQKVNTLWPPAPAEG